MNENMNMNENMVIKTQPNSDIHLIFLDNDLFEQTIEQYFLFPIAFLNNKKCSDCLDPLPFPY
jgi:hypothetical protein